MSYIVCPKIISLLAIRVQSLANVNKADPPTPTFLPEYATGTLIRRKFSIRTNMKALQGKVLNTH